MASMAEGRKYLKLQESREDDARASNLLETDGAMGAGEPTGLGGEIRGKEGFTSFIGPSAVDPINKKEREVMREMEDDFNKSLSKFASTQAQLMEDTKRYVEITAPGHNRYARKIVKFRNGWIGYVTRYGEVKLLPVRPGPNGSAVPADWTTAFVNGMENRPGCGGVMSIPSDFPSVDGRRPPAPGTPIKVDGMTADLFYGGQLPVDKSWNKFGIPCGMEGDNVQVTMMADSEAMWAATQKGKRVGEDTVEAGIYSRPMSQWPSSARYSPPGDQAFIGCVSNNFDSQATSSLEEQTDLGITTRFDCFTRALDVGASAYGLANGKPDGPHVKGTCYITKDKTVDVVAPLHTGSDRSDIKNCSLWSDRRSYRYSTTMKTATVEPSLVVVSQETAQGGLAYGLSILGHLVCFKGGALEASVQSAFDAKEKYWEEKWAIDAKINEKEGEAEASLAQEQLKLQQRNNDLDAARSRRAAALQQANSLIDQAGQAQTVDERASLVQQAQEAGKSAEEAGKDYIKASKALADEEKRLAEVSQKEQKAIGGLEDQRRTQQLENSYKLRQTIEQSTSKLYTDTVRTLPVGGNTPIEDCTLTSEYVGACYKPCLLALKDDGSLFLGTAEDYNKNNGEMKQPFWSWSSGNLMGVALPDLPGCSSHVAVIETDINAPGQVGLIAPGMTLSSPSGTCRVVMRTEPVMVNQQREVGPRRDSNGNWLPAGTETVQVPDPAGTQKAFLELQWFISNCAGLHDSDDIAGIDPRGQGQAAGRTKDAVALHQVPRLPPSPWADGSPAQNAYYVPSATQGKCLSEQGSAPTKLVYPDSTELGTNYTIIQGYDTQGFDIPGAADANVSVEVCKAQCSADSRCAGFVYNKTNKGCYPKTSGMFPAGPRKPVSTADIYLRHIHPTFSKGSVCPTDASASTVYQMGTFKTAGEVPQDMPCDLAAAAGCDQKPIEEAAEKLKEKRGAMLAHIQNLNQADSRLVAELGYNVDRLKNDIDSYNETVSRSGELSGDAMASPQAHQEDTDLQMIQENYRYLLWTIAAVVVASVGLRMAR